MSERPLPAGSTIGILGGGQLGRMMSMAAATLGYRVHIFTPEEDSPAAVVSAHATVAAYDDEAALTRFAANVAVATLEFENVPVSTLRFLERLVPVYPQPSVLEITQHRVREKEFVRSNGIGTAPFAAVGNLDELHAAIRAIGLPAILKTCRLGYDGKGQARIERAEDALAAWESIGRSEAILEGFVAFTKEISVIVARDPAGVLAAYPATANEHRDHMLYESVVPSGEPAAIVARARHIAEKLAEGLGIVGLLAVEMFVLPTGEVLVNELAPRPHNSGHWTLDAAMTSQFEQSIRAVACLPLGATSAIAPARMRNLIGPAALEGARLLRQSPGARLHLYGKNEAKPGRKMGHITFIEWKGTE